MSHYEIVPIRRQDMLSIGKWRNDQIEILRQDKKLSDNDQERYFEFIQQDNKQKLFSYLLNEQCIGYGGLTYIDWEKGEAEVSFLLETSRNRDHEAFLKEFGFFLAFLKEEAKGLGLKKLQTETYEIRPHVIDFLEAEGFRLVKREGKSYFHSFEL